MFLFPLCAFFPVNHLYFQKLALQHVFKKEGVQGALNEKATRFFIACEANLATRLSIPAAMRAKVYSDVEAIDQILAQKVHRKSPKNKVENTPCAETVAAAAAMLALSNRTNVGGWCHTSSAKVMIGEQRSQGGRGRMREREGGNDRGG
jgi:hypothetical protein